MVLIAIPDGYLVNTAVNMPGKFYRMGGMNIGVIQKMLIYLLAGEGIQLYGKNTFFNMVQLKPELLLRYQVGVYSYAL
jgi:hypothetical protein